MEDDGEETGSEADEMEADLLYYDVTETESEWLLGSNGP